MRVFSFAIPQLRQPVRSALFTDNSMGSKRPDLHFRRKENAKRKVEAMNWKLRHELKEQGFTHKKIAELLILSMYKVNKCLGVTD